jgi:hypothetical protein
MIQFFKNFFKRDKRTLDSKAMEWWVSGRKYSRCYYIRAYCKELGIHYGMIIHSNKVLNEYKLTDKQIRLIYKLEHGIQ